MINLRGKVVVITGASSGLGREAAILFAAAGARVALAARRADALAETLRLCRAAGGEAICVVTDVTQEEQVMQLANKVVEQWQRIDIWINNAGVTLFSLLEDAPFAEHRRVIETNLYGAIFGARAVIPLFKRQKSGTMINVGSILSKVGQPFVPSYVISKFALRGLTETLRSEFADMAQVHICSLLPYAIDTPHFQTGANHIGLQAHAMPPVQTPEKVARAMVDLARNPVRERHVPRIALVGLFLHALFPRFTERLLLQVLKEWHFSNRPERGSSGNLFRPDAETPSVHGARKPQLSTPALVFWIVKQLHKTIVPSPPLKGSRA